jgi:DNA-directed RNA polymerase specialized sigma24 family protein
MLEDVKVISHPPAPNWQELEREGFYTKHRRRCQESVKRYAENKSIPYTEEDLEDSVSEAVYSILRAGQAVELGLFCRASRYKFISMICRKQSKAEPLEFLEDHEGLYTMQSMENRLRPAPEKYLQDAEFYSSLLDSKLQERTKAVIKMIIAGYNQSEIASRLKTSIRNIQREYKFIRHLIDINYL